MPRSVFRWFLPAGLLLLLFAACSSDPFPDTASCAFEPQGDFGPEPAPECGQREVPFVQTFLFDFRTGPGHITRASPDSNLKIISAADLLTLLNSAQDKQANGLGVLSGAMTFGGSPVQDVSVKITDRSGRLLAIRVEGRTLSAQGGVVMRLPDGTDCPDDAIKLAPTGRPFDPLSDLAGICIKGSLYYNSPGGIPDFSNNRGTSDQGTFTAFNLPPGEVFVWAIRGARGNGRFQVFSDRISIGRVNVIPVPLPTVGITGSLAEWEDGNILVSDGTITLLGSFERPLTTQSGESGIFLFDAVGSNGGYLLRARKEGHLDTLFPIDTGEVQTTSQFVGVTKTINIVSESFFQNVVKKTGPPAIAGRAILTGRLTAPDGTPQHCAKARVVNDAGTDLLSSTGGASIHYAVGSRPGCANPADPQQTSTSGEFLIYNLPPGDIHLRFTARTATGSISGADVATASGAFFLRIFSDSILVQNATSTGRGERVTLSGKILFEGTTIPAGAVSVSVLGVPGGFSYTAVTGQDADGKDIVSSVSLPAKSDASGAFKILANSASGSIDPFIGGGSYVLRLSGSGSFDTYQPISTDTQETIRNLSYIDTLSRNPACVAPRGNCTPPGPGLGAISGTVFDRVTGKATGVRFNIFPESNGGGPREPFLGPPVGGGEFKVESDGRFYLCCFPPGWINFNVVSEDDSGNIIIPIYPDGVTVAQVPVTKSLPQRVQLKGSAFDLVQETAGIEGGHLALLGKTNGIDTGSGGKFTESLETAGRFVVRATRPGYLDTYNYSLRTGIADGEGEIRLASEADIRRLASSAGLDSVALFGAGTGIVSGQIIENNLSTFESCRCGGIGPAAGIHRLDTAFISDDTILDLVELGALTGANAGKSGVAVYFGGKGGTFAKSAEYPTVGSPVAMVLSDFDLKGNLDIAVIGGAVDNGLSVLIGGQDGKFAELAGPILFNADNEEIPTTGLITAPVAATTGDFNNDRRPDLAVVNGDSTLVILDGRGDGTFTPHVDANRAVVRGQTGEGPRAIVIADFNQDGLLDLAVTNSGEGTITVLMGGTDGTFQPLSDPNTNSPVAVDVGGSPTFLTGGDFNGDGRFDLAVVKNGEGIVQILAGEGNGAFTASGSPIFVGGEPVNLVTGEFNSDARIDLAVPREDGNLLILLGNGDGTFGGSNVIPIGPGVDAVVTSDFDRNGLFDLAVAVGTDLGVVFGREIPLAGVSVEVRSLRGNPIGAVRYFADIRKDSGTGVACVWGTELKPAESNLTDCSGRFIIFNVEAEKAGTAITDSGIVLLRASRGAAGNGIVSVFPDSLTYTKLRTTTLQPFVVSVTGVTFDPVGPLPAGTIVGSVQINLLGTDVRTVSDPATGEYSIATDANGEYIVEMNWTPRRSR